MKIDKHLNLVKSFKRPDGSELFAHSAPIPLAVFDQFWEICGPVMNALYTRGFGLFSPRYASRMLRKIVEEQAGSDKQKQAQELARVEKGFLAEVRRLTNVFVLSDKGWEMLPIHEAKTQELIDEDEVDEIDNSIIFFTCSLRSHEKSQLPEVRGALSVCNAQITSLGCTEFRSFLMTSTVEENTGRREIPL